MGGGTWKGQEQKSLVSQVRKIGFHWVVDNNLSELYGSDENFSYCNSFTDLLLFFSLDLQFLPCSICSSLLPFPSPPVQLSLSLHVQHQRLRCPDSGLFRTCKRKRKESYIRPRASISQATSSSCYSRTSLEHTKAIKDYWFPFQYLRFTSFSFPLGLNIELKVSSCFLL